MLLSLALALLAYLYSQRLNHSPFGRMLKGLRENEEVTRGLGKNISLARAQIMAVGSLMAAIGGVLFALNTGFVNTNDFVVNLTSMFGSWSCSAASAIIAAPCSALC